MAIMNMPPMGYFPRASTVVEKAEAPPVRKLGRDLPKKSSKNPPTTREKKTETERNNNRKREKNIKRGLW